MMPTDDLSTLSALDEKQRALLAEKLGITTCFGLIMADRDLIIKAFAGRRNKPTSEDVAMWQDEARRARSSTAGALATIPSSGWEQVAMFVVAFEQRTRHDTVERRIVAEQTEVEPEAAAEQRFEWPDWACESPCRWMVERVSVPGATMSGTASVITAAEIAPPPARPSTGRPKLDIARATLATARGSVDIASASSAVAQRFPIWDRPTQLVVRLGGPPTGPGTSVVLQLERIGHQKQNIPGELDETGLMSEIDLTAITSDEYTPTLVASASDGSALPCIVKLPPIAVVAVGTAPSKSR